MIDPALVPIDDLDVGLATDGLSLNRLTAAPRLTALLSRLAVDLNLMSSCVEANAIDNAVRTCRACRVAGTCDLWTRSHDEGDANPMPSFCPASSLFEAYVRRG